TFDRVVYVVGQGKYLQIKQDHFESMTREVRRLSPLDLMQWRK
ncbi:7771_t:CDS:1, partial [Paraglomus brasilianum]